MALAIPDPRSESQFARDRVRETLALVRKRHQTPKPNSRMFKIRRSCLERKAAQIPDEPEAPQAPAKESA